MTLATIDTLPALILIAGLGSAARRRLATCRNLLSTPAKLEKLIGCEFLDLQFSCDNSRTMVAHAAVHPRSED